MGTTVFVRELPRCDFCGKDAAYDFNTKMGPWANGCNTCYKKYRRYPELGTGKAQKLVAKKEEVSDRG